MNTQDLRKSAKEVGDAYRRRGTLIVKKAIELENVTGAEVHISIKPPKSSLKPFRYPQTATVDVPAEVPADDGAVASTSAEQGLLPPLQPQVLLSPACTTPKKRLGVRGPVVPDPSNTLSPEDRCAICRIEYDSPEDRAMRSLWMECCYSGSCNWWVHCKCAGLWYENSVGRRK